MSERPKRTTRKPTRFLEEAAKEPEPSRLKRKANELDLERLLKSPKSPLTTTDISDLINASSWDMLSAESRARLAKLLPPTAFSDFQNNSGSLQSSSTSYLADLVLPSVYTDPFFLAAAHTFQDHLFSGWLKDEFKAKVAKYEQGVRDGTLAAPWKDEEWENDHLEELPTSSHKSHRAVKAGSASELIKLAQSSAIQVGDIISYKRNFTFLDISVQKDVLVHAINPHAITVLLESESIQHLPPYLLIPDPPDPVPPTQIMEVTSPTMLETGILDVDGRVERAKRPHNNAWKTFTVYRWREDGISSMDDNKGGRENYGTLYYLRNSHSAENS